MLGWLSSIKESIGSIAGDIISGLNESFNNLGKSITDGIVGGIKDIFVPEEGFLDAKVAAIRQEFAFADSVMSTVDTISEFFDTVGEGKPAKIEIHLENARSIYDYGGTAYALDMTWYADYKPTVDTILSSIMWIFFTWRVFVHLPNIINGIAGTPEDFRGYALNAVGIETKQKQSGRKR